MQKKTPQMQMTPCNKIQTRHPMMPLSAKKKYGKDIRPRTPAYEKKYWLSLSFETSNSPFGGAGGKVSGIHR